MTSIAAKISVDSRGASALYILSDSRISWATPRSVNWDAGQKTFCSQVSADIFGFCGDAFFPPYALRQMVDVINSGLLFYKNEAAEDRHEKAFSVFQSTISSESQLGINDFSVVHGARDGELMSSRFRLWIVRFDSTSKTWHKKELNLDHSYSHLSYIDGSGQKVIRKYEQGWENTSAEGTTRAAFWSFCDALFSQEDSQSGGPPQLVGIWRKGVARHFGIIWCGKRYLAGAQVPDDSHFQSVNWFNQRFECMDGELIKRLPGAQRQDKPNRMA